MAALPPRRNLTPTKMLRQNLSPLQILLQMGFPKNRALKALAATGHRGVQLASDWLLAHVNDSSLDSCCEREYTIYLCPTGPLQNLVHNFWEDSLQKCGWNGAHNLIPHITLCSFFKCEDVQCETLIEALKEVIKAMVMSQQLPSTLKLSKYVSNHYMGFFLQDQQVDAIKQLSSRFLNVVASFCGVSQEPVNKEFHLTLAYGFPSHHFSMLKSLVDTIDHSTPASWEVRIYSRDLKIANKEVRRVVYSHVPKEPDELELLIGDFVYVNNDDIKSSTDGWVEGISWLTGGVGHLPINYLERTAESDAWTLHKAIPVIGQGTSMNTCDTSLLPRRPGISLSLLNLLENSEGSRRSCDILSDSSSTDRLHSRQASLDTAMDIEYPSQMEDLYAKVNKTKKEPLYKFPIEGARRILVVRHGERVDFTFGDWIQFCFDQKGNYEGRDSNMPTSLPARENAPMSFLKDCPLTRIGLQQALLIGEGLDSSNTPVHHVYCSPALRCVMTCTNILKGMGIAHLLPINIEPGLFEWLGWYQDCLPQWMTPQELLEAGYNINVEYKPLMNPEELDDPRESCEMYYTRNAYVSQSLLKITQNQGGTILLVGHAATIDTCTRKLLGGEPRSAQDMRTILRKVPYCAVSTIVQDTVTKKWSLEEPPVLPVTHSANIHYDWKILL